MSSLKEIKSPVKQELKSFNPFLKKALKSDVRLLNMIINYILRKKGKQIRPLFVFLSAKMHGEIDESVYLGAVSIELLHTATLVHDDVVDESYQRRGSFSVNALWKNKMAVLSGDYILAKGMLLALERREHNLLEIISRAVKDMSEGEILQLSKSRKLDIDEDTYFEIIRKKTASLIATSMAVGAASVNGGKAQMERMYQIGQDIGVAFQIRDDVFDYQVNNNTGKPTGNDIKEKKITLPLLYILNKATGEERRKILQLVRRKNDQKEKVARLIEMVHSNGGIDYALKRMEEFKNKAITQLENYPQTAARDALIKLVRYTTDRKK